uniref:Uncharacterized protein n=1 Tax=Siphoviridae sp. ctWf32 TaxID=2827884 RepID=A0A8S5SU58_9CAUD|nr:MAG TPA: hypothetical protein [Siphoviridae sp. ctWf32]
MGNCRGNACSAREQYPYSYLKECRGIRGCLYAIHLQSRGVSVGANTPTVCGHNPTVGGKYPYSRAEIPLQFGEFSQGKIA